MPRGTDSTLRRPLRLAMYVVGRALRIERLRNYSATTIEKLSATNPPPRSNFRYLGYGSWMAALNFLRPEGDL